MNFSNELIEKAKTASSAAELLEMAKDNGIELSAAEAETFFSFLKDNGRLSDEELNQVAGGKGDKPDPKYRIGQRLWVYFPECNSWLRVVVYEYLSYCYGCKWEYLVCGVDYCFSEKIYLEVNEWRVRTKKP